MELADLHRTTDCSDQAHGAKQFASISWTRAVADHLQTPLCTTQPCSSCMCKLGLVGTCLVLIRVSSEPATEAKMVHRLHRADAETSAETTVERSAGLEGEPALVKVRGGSNQSQCVPEEIAVAVPVEPLRLFGARIRYQPILPVHLAWPPNGQWSSGKFVVLQTGALALWNSTEHACFSSPVTVQP